jgi:predicted RNA-binding Zn ribbon-like protein
MAEVHPNESVSTAATAIVDLLNSRAYAGMADKLDHSRQATRVLRPFTRARAVPSPERLELVRAVRTELVALADVHGTTEAPRRWAAVTSLASDIAFAYVFAGDSEARLRQVAGDEVVGGIVRAVATLVETGNWARLKLCASDVCRGAFFDTTRSRTRRWHSYEMCGNRSNVAAYRARAARRD